MKKPSQIYYIWYPARQKPPHGRGQHYSCILKTDRSRCYVGPTKSKRGYKGGCTTMIIADDGCETTISAEDQLRQRTKKEGPKRPKTEKTVTSRDVTVKSCNRV